MKKKILLVKGGLDGHDRGLHVVTRVLRDSGLEIVYGGLYCSPEEIAQIAIEEDVEMLGISIHTGAHLGIFSEVLRILKSKTNDEWFVFGGGIIPQKDMPVLREMGVRKIFLPGTDTKDIVEFIEEEPLMAKEGDPQNLIEKVKSGDSLAASRLMTLIQHGDEAAKIMVYELPPLSKNILLIGVTGPGGVGKSTLIDKLICPFRLEGKTVGVVVCDPVSVSGGSVLGDRIRMRQHFLDEGVFIRSLTQYSNYKGVTPETPYIIKIFGAMKKDVIIVETVGVGQEDLKFKDLVEIMVYVSSPGLGDEIQLLKGGVIETADIIVINQSDRPGADTAFQNFLNYFGQTKMIFKTNAALGDGVPELAEGIREYKRLLQNRAA